MHTKIFAFINKKLIHSNDKLIAETGNPDQRGLLCNVNLLNKRSVSFSNRPYALLSNVMHYVVSLTCLSKRVKVTENYKDTN
jgi:hypothetical protein